MNTEQIIIVSLVIGTVLTTLITLTYMQGKNRQISSASNPLTVACATDADNVLFENLSKILFIAIQYEELPNDT